MQKLRKLFVQEIDRQLYSADPDFDCYITHKTGYHTDIFSDLRKRVAEIIKQNKISNERELQDVYQMQAYYFKHPGEQDDKQTLERLAEEYRQKKTEERKQEPVHIQPKYYYKHVADIKSPNGKFSVIISESGADESTATTQMMLNNNKNGSVGLLTLKGINLGIKAYWKDSNNLVINGKKFDTEFDKPHLIQYNDDAVKIEYFDK